ncbi:MAG: hypothetical protein J5570_00135 [Lachnospiraceae bacterium]|nr:hypothetical protein [Lachnospiraceae bacterium]
MNGPMLQILLPLILISAIFLYLCLQKKNPASVAKNKKGKYPDSYTVSVWTFSRTVSGMYIDHIFTKRKNGKYRLKYGIFDWVTTLVTVVPMACIYIFLLYDFSDSLRKYPDMIPAFIGITIDLIMLTALFNNTKIRARIFFRNFIKIK